MNTRRAEGSVPDAATSMLDILQAMTSDEIVRQKARRQFETIGEKVGENLLPLFENESIPLDERDRLVVAETVIETFRKAHISSELLVKGNLEPTRLAKHLFTVNPAAMEHFSEIQEALYRRIIKECCEYIVDIASQLPTFTERGFAEILYREDQLISITTAVLDEVRHMRRQLNSMEEAGLFELDYRRAIARSLDVLQLFGAEMVVANRRYRLSVAYVTLLVEQRARSIPQPGDSTSSQAQQDIARTTTIVPIDKALADSNHLLIRGLAGSGKTTLLQWIAVRSASRSFEKQLSDWNKTLPFYIRLRQFAKSELPRPETFPGLVAPEIADMMPKGWVHTILQSGEAIVLVDGVDEIPISQREEVHTWLTGLVETYPKARFVVTSRPHAVEEGWLNRKVFTNAELQPMELLDIHTFINHWHEAIQGELQEEAEKAELPSLAEGLKEAIKYNRSLYTLATTPLLCAMLCALNRNRRQQLPRDRIELYDECCQLLIERRDKVRRIELTQDYPSLTYRQKRVLLADLAYYLMKNGWSEIQRPQVDGRFTKQLAAMQDIPLGVSGADVRRLFVDRTSIIREPAENKISFTHRTFQEFLAAYQAVDDEDTGLLVKNAVDDQWREVIILAAGLATTKVRESLIEELIKRGDMERHYRYQLHLLAISCLGATVKLGQVLKTKLEKRLTELVPPKSMTDAVSLASAGELVVPYLFYTNRQYDAETSAACIRTLSLIASDTALEAIEGYTRDASSMVIEELLRAWDSFDRETYARRVLAHALQGTYRAGRIYSLEGFQYFTQVTSLDLSLCEQIRDLSPLSSLTQLTSLNLWACKQIRDLSPLSSLTQLTFLDLSYCEQIRDLSPLVSLERLASLNLSGCYTVRDLEPLTQLSSLKSLRLDFISHQVTIPQSLKRRVKITFQT